MHVNSGAYLSKKKIFLIFLLIGRHTTLLYFNNDYIYWILLENEHLYSCHSNLVSFCNENFNSFAPGEQCCLLTIPSVIMHRLKRHLLIDQIYHLLFALRFPVINKSWSTPDRKKKKESYLFVVIVQWK